VALGVGVERLRMRKSPEVMLTLAVACAMVSCVGRGATTAGSTAAVSTEVTAPGAGRVVTGAEALELYGAAASPTPGPPTATPQIWFPARAWVEPAILPYDPNETIDFLPMFSNMTLDENGLWMGDLGAGEEVVLHGVSADGSVCLVEGDTLQGWSTKGWVACNRLRFTEPGG
jgi:hypothetical protein